MKALEIAAIALALSIFSAFVSKKTVRKEEMQNLRKRLEKLSKEYKKVLEKDERLAKELEREMYSIAHKLMMRPLRSMVITFPVSILAFYYVSQTYGDFRLDLPFSLPLLGNQLNWLSYFILLLLIIGLPLNRILERVL